MNQTSVLCKWCKTQMVGGFGFLYCPHCDIPCPDPHQCSFCRRLNHQW